MTASEDQARRDAHTAWTYAVNCVIREDQLLQPRGSVVDSYAIDLLDQLAGDRERLLAAARAACIAAADEVGSPGRWRPAIRAVPVRRGTDRGEGGRAVNGADHYVWAERLLDRVRGVLDSDDQPDERNVFLVSVVAVHARLVAAAVAGLTADLPRADADGWRKAAGRPVTEWREE